MEKDKIIKICVASVIAIFAIIYYFVSNNENDYEAIAVEEIVKENTVSEQTVENISKIKIYITGEVNKSGVYELNEGDRIEDAVMAAEGLTDDADLTNVNLAYELSDGEKIYIPNKSDGNNLMENSNSTSNGKININKANLSELTEIPGIGSSTAQKIIDYREKNGKFSSIDDIKKVSGIGDSKFESIKEYISVK